MFKYQKKGLCKALSMLLAAVMLLISPIGITQAYALEDELSATLDVQGELLAADLVNLGPLTLATPTGLQWDTADKITAKWNAVENAASYAVTLWKEGQASMVVQRTGLTGTEVSFQDSIAGSTGNYYFTVQAMADGYTPSLKTTSPSHSYIVSLNGNATIENMSSEIGDTLTVPASSRVLEVSSPVELQNMLTLAKDGDTIQLTKDIVYNENTTAAYAVITIKGKNITLDINSHNLTINNTGYGMGLRLVRPATNERNATQLHVIGNGNLKITSTGNGLAVDASKFTSASTVNVEFWSLSGSGIGGNIAEVYIQNGSVTGHNGIYVANNSIIIVKGLIKATGDIGIKLKPSKMYDDDIGCVVSVDSVEAAKCGISLDGGNVTIDGTITAPGYIQFNDEDSTAIDDYWETTTKADYRTYQHATAGTVWVKGEELSDNDCEIDGTQYATFDKALAAVQSGETKTIKLLQSVTHTNPITVDKKTINFDLGNYDLFLDTSADLSYTPALRVIDGGKVELTGTGTGKFHVKGYSTAIAINGMNSEATVHNVEVTGDSDGVYMVGTGDNLDSNSSVTVKGDIKAEKGNGVIVNAKNGKVIVNGKITAGKIGVEIASNPGTEVTVNGDITVIDDRPDNLYNMVGIRAYGETTVAVTGDVTVRGTNCVGVHASGSTIKVDGNVTSSDKGAHSDANGEVEINGSLSAGTPFIIVGTTEKAADQVNETIPNFLVYTDGTNIVRIGSVCIPVPTYTINVLNDGNGTASANINSAAQNTEVTLTATPNGDFRFKEWKLVSGDVTITSNKFTMSAENVVIRAIFETIPVTNHTVTFDLGGGTRTGGGALTQTVPNGGSAIEPNVTRSGYTFIGWDKAFINVIQSLTVTATWRYNGGGSGGTGGNGGTGGSGSSSNDRYNIIVTTPAQEKLNTPTQIEIKVDGKVDTSGNLIVAIIEKNIIDTINKAIAEAKKNGNEANGVTLVLNVHAGDKTINNVTVNLPKTVQDTIIIKKIVSTVVVVDNPNIKIDMDLSTIKEINKQANADVYITAKRMDSGKLIGNAKTAIGHRPVFNLKVNYGSGKVVQNFGAGGVSVTIPYTLSANEKAGNVQAVYVDASGKVQWLVSSVYDSVNKLLRFSTNHFSTYGVGYKQDAPDFTDINDHWAKSDIQFVVNSGLFSGTSKTTFSPNTAITRGMFVTALGRLANTDVSIYKQSSFTDVKNDVYYMGYIEWANKNNIVTGIGDGKFAPDQSITCEQMAVIMSNYAKTIGFTLPKVHSENTFTDNVKVSIYAKAAVKTMQMAGVISGKSGNIFDPQGTATRAEVSVALHRFVELAISSDTMQGWTMNDFGMWMYYENGEPITGKKNIDGSFYTFDQYGVTLDAPKNLKYTTYTVQKDDSFWLIAHKLSCTMVELEWLNNKSRFDLIHLGDVLRVSEK